MILATKQGTDGMTQPYTQPYTNPTPGVAAWDPNRNGNVEALNRPLTPRKHSIS